MPDTSGDVGSRYDAPTASAASVESIPPGGPNPAPRSAGSGRGWLVPLALLLAGLATALSIWSLLSRSGDDGAGALPGDPKLRVCSAFETVSRAVALQTHNDLGPDQVAQAAVAGNARLALLGGGEYLLRQIDSATPADLAEKAAEFARDLQDIGMNTLAGVQNSDPGQAARLAEGDSARKQVVDLCK